MTEENFKSENRFFIVSKHLKELNEKRSDKAFGLLRLKHHHESFLFNYYYKAYKESKGSFYGYELIRKSNIHFGSFTLTGSILSFEMDDLLESLTNINFYKNISPEELFEKFIYTPSVFLFLPDKELFAVCNSIKEMFKNNLCVEGNSKNNKIVFIEPFTAYKLGLGFLIEKLIKDENIHCLLMGFIYEDK